MTTGKLEPFDADTTEWTKYQEGVQLYFAANVAKDKQKAVFLTVCRPTTYSLLQILLVPMRSVDVTLTAIFAALSARFKPKVPKVITSFKFLSRRRQESECVNDYIAALNRLLHDCNWTDIA